MVQKVQTAVGEMQPTTLDTIEAVGTSSRKLREWRQTTGERFLGYCTTTENTLTRLYTSWGSRDSGMLQLNNLTIDTTSSNLIYTMKDGGVRIPKGWTYQVEITWSSGWFADMTATLYVKTGNGQTLYTETSTNNSQQTDTFLVNVGKFDTIEVWVDYHYSWSSSAISTFFKAKLKITEL